MDGPLKEYWNKKRTDKTRTKLTETTLTTPTSIHTNKTKAKVKLAHIVGPTMCADKS